MKKTIVAIFDSHSAAEKAAKEIKDQGLRTEDISIVVKEKVQRNSDTSVEAGSMAFGADSGEEGRGRGINDNISDGVMTGGVLGGLAGVLIGAGSMAVPGLGIIAAAGPITGLIAGAVTGGVVGGLVDMGIPENRSRQYETDIKAGKALFSMRAEDENIDSVASILRNNGAESVDSY